jgi:regulator of protease activity HflC (stomatin/prohibitin superfamily)
VNKRVIAFGVATILLLALAVGAFHLFVNRIYVPEGSSLLLRYKGPLIFGSGENAPQGHWAAEGQVGVLEKLRGPGRHFYSPIWWERNIVPNVTIQTGEVGVVTCKLGDALPEGQFLVDGEIGQTKEKGVLRKVLGPGRYRINPYGYEVTVITTEVTKVGKSEKHSGWVQIPTGYVGVVTNLADIPNLGQKVGIQEKVLQPGLYPVNPKEQQIDIVGIGYWETAIDIKTLGKVQDLTQADETGESADIKVDGGIGFPSSDGFKINMDFTAIWGIMPDQAANAVRKFGSIPQVEQKVIVPQIESICRNNGSEYTAVQLLVGKEREKFQTDTLRDFRNVLKNKDLSLLSGLVRHIYIPKEVRQPIQTAFIADELKLTRVQEQQTTKAEADLREAERKVVLETERVKADAKRLVAEKIAEGQKTVGEMQAETRKLTAAIERETAELQSQAKLLLGQADAEGKKLIEQSRANRFKLAVEAFGTASAYNNWTFASNLPDNIELRMLYAGQGTLWTDAKENLKIMVQPMPAAKTENTTGK